jgi:Arc/MetJ-type ribon-helix-helix transcriptional regulator
MSSDVDARSLRAEAGTEDSAKDGQMPRITVRVPEERLAAIEERVEAGVYPNRSECVREALRQTVGISDGTSDGWRTRRKPKRRNAPTVTVTDDRLRLHKAAHEALGEPEFVRFLVDGDCVAIAPCPATHPDGYRVFGDSTQQIVAGGWLSSELERGEQPEGQWPLVDHDGLHVVDFSPEEGDA